MNSALYTDGGSAFYALLTIIVSWRISLIRMRSSTSLSNILLHIVDSSFEYIFGIRCSYLLMTDLFTCCGFPSNGFCKLHISWSKQPNDQISVLLLYGWLLYTSGLVNTSANNLFACFGFCSLITLSAVKLYSAHDT